MMAAHHELVESSTQHSYYMRYMCELQGMLTLNDSFHTVKMDSRFDGRPGIQTKTEESFVKDQNNIHLR